MRDGDVHDPEGGHVTFLDHDWIPAQPGGVFWLCRRCGINGTTPVQPSENECPVLLRAALSTAEAENVKYQTLRKNLGTLFGFSEMMAQALECGHPLDCIPEHTAAQAKEPWVRCQWCAAIEAGNVIADKLDATTAEAAALRALIAPIDRVLAHFHPDPKTGGYEVFDLPALGVAISELAKARVVVGGAS